MYLDFFKGKKKLILQCRSGMPLFFDDGYLRLPTGERVVCLSKQRRDELQDWAEKDYQVQSAKVNFIVAWKNKEDMEETP